MTDPRADAVRALLAREGVAGPVDITGEHGDVVAVRTPPESRPALARLAPAVRELGFRYLTIDLNPGNQ